MNLREKLRAIDRAEPREGRPETAPARDCVHRSEIRAGARAVPELTRETLALMTGACLPEPFDPRRILFLDTETTGLGGSGTVAFLTGLGFLTDRGFEVHQFWMRDYPEEPLMLRHVAAGLERFDVLCTFNGSTFDVPLLEGRFLMNRMDRGALDLPHVDMLHLCRRLWKLRLGRCNLGHLEEVILGKPRQDDLPGSEVPQRYFSYLKTGQVSLLEDVLAHNAQDIASLWELLNHMAVLYRHPERIRFGEDVYAMGRALERMRKDDRARECYRLARSGSMGTEASAALARNFRRGGEKGQAAEIWREMIARRQGGAAPYIELAKYLEHAEKDIPGALRATEQAIALTCETGLFGDGTVQETEKELQYRYQRLRRRMKELEKHGNPDDIQGHQSL